MGSQRPASHNEVSGDNGIPRRNASGCGRSRWRGFNHVHFDALTDDTYAPLADRRWVETAARSAGGSSSGRVIADENTISVQPGQFPAFTMTIVPPPAVSPVNTI